MGFEPTDRLFTGQRFSRAPHSTALPPLRALALSAGGRGTVAVVALSFKTAAFDRSATPPGAWPPRTAGGTTATIRPLAERWPSG